MTTKIDILRHDAPLQLASFLSTAGNEDVEIAIPDVELCPNRIVPVVGLADAWFSRGHAIRFNVPPYSVGEKALVGFNAHTLNADSAVAEAFGRVWRFDNAREQTNIVNAMVLELDKTANLAKGVKQCFEWCLNEVTDNVLNHSRPQGGAHGYVMVQYLPSDGRLKICVFDSGIGLKESFVGSKYSPATAEEAICLAVGKGVTNGKGQGNGLWGLHEMVKVSKRGKLHIRSDGAEYLYDPARAVESSRKTWVLPGFPGTTTVDFQMECSDATTLQDIFGADYVSVDLWQEAREQEDGSLCLKVAELADGYGSRESARKVRHVVENAIDNDRKFVTLDFTGVDRCSSSFVDELVAKLVAKYGVLSYTRFFKISNLVGLALGLANLSAAQRLSTPTPTPNSN
ncbi:MAG: STAS-like domain-containing protein [Kiritimatiellae bacterium]|nr:STAS-like domain-containing protein [Kiritimatiellia bacterium]